MYQGTHEAWRAKREARWYNTWWGQDMMNEPPRHMVRAEPYTGKTLVDAATFKAVNNTRLPHIGSKQLAKVAFRSLLKGPQS